MAKIAFLGTGLIGSGMVEGLLSRGDGVTVWNRTAEKAHALASRGARVASSPEEAVRDVDRVHFAFTDDVAVDQLLSRCGPHLGRTPVIDHTTTSPAGTAARFERCAREGLAFLHAPVFMSPQGCRESRGMMLCSGPEALFQQVRDQLSPMTGDVWYLGERSDLAAAYKLFGNAMILTIVAGLADVFAMARSLDIPPSEAHALFARFKPAATIDVRGTKMAAGDFAPTFELAMARKDLRLMLETAARGDVALAVLPAIADRMDRLITEGDGSRDVGVLARHFSAAGIHPALVPTKETSVAAKKSAKRSTKKSSTLDEAVKTVKRTAKKAGAALKKVLKSKPKKRASKKRTSKK